MTDSHGVSVRVESERPIGGMTIAIQNDTLYINGHRNNVAIPLHRLNVILTEIEFQIARYEEAQECLRNGLGDST